MSDLLEQVADVPKVEKANSDYLNLRNAPSIEFDNTVSDDYLGLRNMTSERAGDIDWAKSLWGTVEQSPDPGKAREDIGLALHLKQYFPDVPIENIYNNTKIYAEAAEEQGKPAKTTLQQSWDAFSDARRSTAIGKLSDKLMDASTPEEAEMLQEQIKKLKSEMSSPAGNKDTWLSKWLDPAFQFAGSFYDPAITMTAWNLGLNAAFTFLAPEYAIPAWIVKGVTGLTSMGMTFDQTRRIETGLLYDQMIDAEVPPEIAKKHAKSHGVLAGAIEVLQLEGFFTGASWLSGSMTKAVQTLMAGKLTALGGAKLLAGELAKTGVKLSIGATFNSIQEVAQDASGLHYMKKAQTDPAPEYWNELSKFMDPADIELLYAAYMNEVQKHEEYYGSEEYAEEAFKQLLDTAVSSWRGSFILEGAGGAVKTTFNLGKTGVQSAIERRQNIKDEAKRQARKIELEKEKEALKGQPETEYNKKRGEAINEELTDIEGQENEAVVDESLAAEKEALDKFIKNQTPENKENLDATREQRDEVETAVNKTPVQEAYDEKLAKPEFDQNDVDELMMYNDQLETEEPEHTETPNAQLNPDEINRQAVTADDEAEIKRLAQVVKEKMPDLPDVEAEVALGAFVNVLAEGMEVSKEQAVQIIFKPEIAMNVKAGDTVNINGHEVQVKKGRRGSVFFDPDDGKAIILLTEKADFSTWTHEMSHILRRYVKGDLLTKLEKHYKVKNGRWTRAAEEKFAEHWETFLMTGQAPTPELENIFQILARALLNVYNTLAGREMVSDDIRTVFEQILADPKSAFGNKQAGVSQLDQIIGEQGAKALDEADGVTTRMSNLDKAKKYHGKDKGRHIIKYATGWELGDDGNWKYEINDIRIKDTEADKLLNEKNKQYQALEERNKELLAIPAFQRTEEETQELKEVTRQMKAANKEISKIWKQRDKEYSKYNGKSDLPIETFVEADEVFKAYPQLKDVKVHIMTDDEIEGYAGWYDGANNEIAINEKILLLSQKEIRKTFAHEIQHVIQDIEGFAPGGNAGQFTTTDLDAIEKKVDKMPKGEDKKKLKETIKALKKSIDKDYVDLTEFGIPGIVTPYEAYMRLAGEVEARNVEARLEFTPEQRRLIILADTAEYDKAGQIFLEEAAKSAGSSDLLFQEEEDTYRTATERGEFVPDEILEQYKGQDWADAEIETREDYRKEALEYILNNEDVSEFLADMSVSGQRKQNDYLQEIWASAKNAVGPNAEQQITSLSRNMLSRILYVLKRIYEKEGVNKLPDGILGEAVRNYKKDHILEEAEYKKLIGEIKKSPDKYINLISDCFENDQEFKDLLTDLYLHPEKMKDEMIKELQRAIRGDRQSATTTYNKLLQEISDLEAEVKEERRKGTTWQKLANRLKRLRERQKLRELYNKAIRRIYKKIPKMCHYEEAKQIREEWAKYTRVKMRDTTRAKLNQQLLAATNPDVKSKIQLALDQQPLRDMTLEQVCEIADKIDALRKKGVNRKMDEALFIREVRLETASGLKDDVKTSKIRHVSGSLSDKKNKGNWGQRIISYWADIHRMTDWMGKHWGVWLDKIKTAFEGELRNVDRRMTALNNKMKELKLSAKTLSKVEKIGNEKFTHNELMGIYIGIHNEDSLAAIVFGNFHGKDNPNDPALLESIRKNILAGISRLTPEERQFAEWMVKSFEGNDRERLWQAYMIRENKVPPIVAWYFPMKRRRDGSFNFAEEPVIDLGSRTSMRMASVKKGFMEGRVNISPANQSPIRLDALNIYTEAIHDQEHYIAFGQLGKDMKYVYGKVKGDVARKFGNNWANSVEEWINLVIDPRAYNNFYDQQNAYSQAISNNTIAVLTYNMLTILKQFPSVALFLPYCDAGHLFLSITKFPIDFKNMTETAFEKSVWLKNRSMDDLVARTEKQLANPDTKLRGAKQFSEWGMRPIKWVDEFACVIGWNAVYTTEMEHGATEEEAVNKANQALLRTQPQAFAMFTPKGYRNPMLRPVLLFTRQINQLFQIIASDTPNMLLSDEAILEKTKTFTRTVFCLSLNAMVMAWAGNHFRDYGDDDDKSLFTDTISQILNIFPVLGPTMAALLQRKTYSAGGYVDPISSTAKAWGKFMQKSIDNKELDYDGLMKSIIESMGPAGLPKTLSSRAYRAGKEKDWWYLFTGGPKEGK